ncbi:hypothetical protein H0Z60_17235 [Ectothiorhodospiraceae bacterium WFHF3C12]|nr:hypothetical protein [Ectothiorhodospiraceae bacterium WFHF3C12]
MNRTRQPLIRSAILVVAGSLGWTSAQGANEVQSLLDIQVFLAPTVQSLEAEDLSDPDNVGFGIIADPTGETNPGSPVVVVPGEDDETAAGFNEVPISVRLSMRPHNQVKAFVELDRDNSPGGGGGSLEDGINVDKAWVELMDLAPHVNVRIGSQAWALWQFRGVSDAGVVQGNPLIGNALMDAVVENNGIQVHGKPGPWGYSLLVANPDDEGDMSGGRGFALGGKLYTALGAGFSVAGAYYQVHNDSDTTSGFAPTVVGEAYRFPSKSDANADTQTQFGFAGRMGKFDSWRVAAQYKPDYAPLKVALWYGNQVNDVPDGAEISPALAAFTPGEFEMNYYGTEITYDLTPRFWVAGRYNVVTQETDGAASDDASRSQVGLGYHVTENVRAKLEYVDQRLEGPDAWAPFAFNGVISELGVVW